MEVKVIKWIQYLYTMKKTVFLIIFISIGVAANYFFNTPKEKPLPILNPVDLEDEMVDSLLVNKGYGHTIGDFSFANQDGNTITQEDLKGKVYVAEYFFTTCKSICPIMNKQMMRVHNAYGDNDDFRILSFTVDPDVDTVEQMKRYALEHNAIGNNWHFLTGKKEDLYSLARTSFFVLKPAEAQNLGDAGSDFIHTNNFVLVDKKRRIRGYYNGTSPERIDSLIHDIQHLIEE